MTLTPDRQLTQSIILFAALILVIGMPIILHMPLSAVNRAGILSAWLAFQCFEIYQFARTSARCRRLHFSGDKGICGDLGQGASIPLERRAGSLIAPRFAWLRLQSADGEQLSTLLLADRIGQDRWRRLQVALRFSQ